MNSLKKETQKINKKKVQLISMMYALLLSVTTSNVFATGTTNPTTSTNSTADAKWNGVIGFILPWISRLGGVVILIGAVEFGMAFKNDDAEGKTKGIRTIIAGCIVLTVGLSSSTFLY